MEEMDKGIRACETADQLNRMVEKAIELQRPIDYVALSKVLPELVLQQRDMTAIGLSQLMTKFVTASEATTDSNLEASYRNCAGQCVLGLEILGALGPERQEYAIGRAMAEVAKRS